MMVDMPWFLGLCVVVSSVRSLIDTETVHISYLQKKACTVEFFVNETNGINGTATRTVSLSANTVTEETFTGIDGQWVFITSNKDIIVSSKRTTRR